jgi:NAD(P)-dependent dehydrogenase (short-subunit alcohol dehydrogenase family)
MTVSDRGLPGWRFLNDDRASRALGLAFAAVLPGPVWTPLIPSTMPPDQVAEFGKQVPMGRPGQPAELAPIYVLLASDEASYMSGGAYPVRGGNPVL